MTTVILRCAKLQTDHHNQLIQHSLFTGWMPLLSPN